MVSLSLAVLVMNKILIDLQNSRAKAVAYAVDLVFRPVSNNDQYYHGRRLKQGYSTCARVDPQETEFLRFSTKAKI